MKCTKFINLAAATLLLVGLTGAGCQKKPQGITPIGQYQRGVTDDQRGGPLGSGLTDSPAVPISGVLKDWLPAANQPAILRENTVYFAYDRSEVRASETSKLDAIASYMKGAGDRAVRVEGHCDERGTEEYNRSLGERRALSVREYLVNRAGVSADRVDTISHGEDRPAVAGRGDAVWAKNRRAEFILLQPPGGVGATGPQ